MRFDNESIIICRLIKTKTMETRPLIDISEENQRRVAAKMARLDLLRPLTIEDHQDYVRLDLQAALIPRVRKELDHNFLDSSRRKVA